VGKRKTRGPFCCKKCGVFYYTAQSKGEGESYCSRRCSGISMAEVINKTPKKEMVCPCGNKFLSRYADVKYCGECKKHVEMIQNIFRRRGQSVTVKDVTYGDILQHKEKNLRVRIATLMSKLGICTRCQANKAASYSYYCKPCRAARAREYLRTQSGKEYAKRQHKNYYEKNRSDILRKSAIHRNKKPWMYIESRRQRLKRNPYPDHIVREQLKRILSLNTQHITHEMIVAHREILEIKLLILQLKGGHGYA